VVLDPGQEAQLKAYYSQDQGFGTYLIKFLTFEWGYSYAFMDPVSSLIMEALPWTLLLLGLANLLGMALGFYSGVEAAWRQGPLERGLVSLATVLEGVPEIATSVVLLAVFALKLGWLPAQGAETAYAQVGLWQRLGDIFLHMILPLTTLTLAYAPGNFLLTRNSMIMVLGEPYITTAKAKGLPPARVRYAHSARNALLPLVTRLGLRMAFMITGALVVETIFAYPGLGTLLYNAISNRDLPLIQGVVLVSALVFLGLNLALEMTYRRLDPRIKDAS
jgi:peptide/nickel transport system permease protein